MKRAIVLFVRFAALAIALALVARPAMAQERRIETAAKDALKKARADFQAQDYDTGVVRLRKATKACGTIRCTPSTRAQLLRDLGAMQLKRGDKQGASQSFTEAIHADPKVALVAPYDTPDVRAEWNAARDEASIVGQTPPAGDFETQAAQEQVENTPLPVYVEYGGSAKLESVAVKYRGEGDGDWKKADLARVGKGWGGLIPCGDVRHGVVRYYVQGIDSSGTPVAMSGDPRRPFAVPIRHAIASPAPALPGQAPPTKCAPGGGCPPDNPTCNEAPVATESHAEEVPQCDEDSQCASGVCEDGRCVEPKLQPSRGFARWWVGIEGSADLTSLPSADDVCALSPQATPVNAAGYYCTFPSGADYPTRRDPDENSSLTPGQAGHVDGGPSFAAIRVLVAIDYAVNASLLVGVRAGYVGHAYPGAAIGNDGKGFTKPIHFEARGTYLFGDQPLEHAGFAPMAFVSLGAAQFAAEKDVLVRQNGQPLPVAGALPRQAWLVGGPVFVGVGGGMRYAFSQRWGFTMAAKLSGAFGGSGFTPVLAPELGLQYGF